MISIIISKYHPTLIENLKENIKNTIGVPFELVVIENGEGKMGLCEVYNMGAQKARYEILCYAHEDIEIQTMNWGGKVIEIFSQQERLGLLGAAGLGYKSLSPSGWWYDYANPKIIFTNYIQSNGKRNMEELFYSNPQNKNLSAAVCVDGFWFCTRKYVALELRFDDSTFKGFHCYDIDFSLRVFQQYEVAVCFGILIKHYSDGGYNSEWINETLMLSKKWEDVLPFNGADFNKQSLRQEEVLAFNFFLKRMVICHYPLKQVFFLLWSSKVRSFIGLKGFIKLNIKAVINVFLNYKFN